MTLQKKLIAIGAGVSLAVLTVLVAVGWQQGGNFGKIAQRESEKLAIADRDHIAGGLTALVKAQDDLLSKKVESQNRVFWHVMKQSGEISFGGSETWQAINQFTKKVHPVTVPRMFVGGQWLQHNFEFSQPTPIVDKVTSLTDGPCTFFQRINEQGDMLRVSTTVKAKDGKRGVSTFIPAINPNGKPNPVVTAMLNKKDWSGSAYIVDAWYQTYYQPFIDANGKVIGMSFNGVKQESVPSLRQAIQAAKIGNDGYVMVVGGTGDKQGQVLVSPSDKRDGEKIYEEKDAAGKQYIKDIVDQAIKLSPGEIGTATYRIEKDGAVENVTAHFAYYKPWDWIIVANGFEKDFLASSKMIGGARSQMIASLIGAGLLMAVLAGFTFWWQSKRIVGPISQMVKAADSIADGDLAVEIDCNSRDEVGRLAVAFRRMQNSLSELSTAARQVADGDLTAKFSPRGPQDALGNAFADMLGSLRALVGQVVDKARQTASTSGRLSIASGQVAESATEVERSMQEVTNGARDSATASESIAKGNNQLAVTASDAARSMGQLETGISSVQEGSLRQEEATQKAATVAATGGQAVESAIQSMDRIEQKVILSSTAVKDLGSRQEQIGSIVVAIGEIAEQTNLLALNAAIESARAGEMGRGFAVVADEVRKLAERSSVATQEIRDLIEMVRQGVKQAMEAMDQSLSEVSEGARHGASARGALNEIVLSVDEVSTLAKSNGEAVKQVVSTAQQVVEAIRVVAAASEETASGAEELGATSEEMSASAEQVNHSIEEQVRTIQTVNEMAGDLTAQSEDLNRMVARFRLESDSNGHDQRLAA